jgi:uncharacterized protein YbjT (DUF2867 family)
MYVITGATGNTGKPLTFALLAAGKKVRIISRGAEKAKELVDKGAELFIGDTTDQGLLEKAFDGATAVYAMIPFKFDAPDYLAFQKSHADPIVSAIEKTGVPYAVTLSSVGADLSEGAGVVEGLNYLEQKLDAIMGLNVLHLRPTYFMENTLSMVGMIKQMGIMGSPVKPDLKLNMIATRDIGEYAAKRMIDLDFKGRNVQYLLGQRDLTYGEIAKIYGKAINKPDLNYVEFPYDQFKQGFIQMGASESLADRMNEFITSLNAGKVLENARRDDESTTPTSIEDFADTFAYIYNMD